MKISDMMMPGMPAIRVVIIKPKTPRFEMMMKPRGKPRAAVIVAIMRLKVVWPWPFMRLPRLRLPRAPLFLFRRPR